MSGDLAFLGIAEAAELIRAKKLSPVEYTKALLGQIERHDGKFNAFISVTPERAMTAARAAEAAITAGSWRGPFHGMPYALKDIIDVEGIATTAHSKVTTGNAARQHAVVTERLEADPQPRLDVRHHRDEGDLRSGQPPRGRAARVLARPCRPDDPHGARQRPNAPSDRRA
jgi:hypothetical protein